MNDIRSQISGNAQQVMQADTDYQYCRLRRAVGILLWVLINFP
jgi:hypothetical protein